MRTTAEPFGVTWIVGCPQSGKTTLALWIAAELARARRVPVLLIDSQSVHNFAQYRALAPAEAVRELWGKERRSARVVPEDLGDVEALARAVQRGRRAVVLIDEAHYWLNGRTPADAETLHLMRATQHAQADVILTTQHLTGDVPAAALSCTNRLYVFRCQSPRVLQVLEKEYGLDRARVSSLPQYRCLLKRIGF